jgi:hypothetical protein
MGASATVESTAPARCDDSVSLPDGGSSVPESDSVFINMLSMTGWRGSSSEQPDAQQ